MRMAIKNQLRSSTSMSMKKKYLRGLFYVQEKPHQSRIFLFATNDSFSRMFPCVQCTIRGNGKLAWCSCQNRLNSYFFAFHGTIARTCQKCKGCFPWKSILPKSLCKTFFHSTTKSKVVHL